MSQSPFQNTSPETESDVADAQAPVPPVRRLQSPAERFRAGEIARDVSKLVEVSPFDAPLHAADAAEHPDAALEPQPEVVEQTPDPFQPLPRVSEVRDRRATRARRGVETRRARRRLKQHAPHYYQKNPHSVAHKPIKPASDAEPHSDWDKAAQNSMARAALARKRARVRRIFTRVLLASGVLLALWGGATALTAPQFAVSRVEINGIERTPTDTVKNLAGQLMGQNVFRAQRAQVEQKVEALPTVKEARVARGWSWPPHMKVEIIERQPILQVGAGTTWWVADAQGVAFRRSDRNDGQLEMLTSSELQPVTGKPLPAAPWKRARELREAISADNALVAAASGAPKRGKFWDLRRVYLDKNGAAALRVSDKGTLKQHGELLIRLGEEGWPEKLKQARVALQFFERTGSKASELDLVSSEHPRWRPKAEEGNSESEDLNVDGQE